jgi:hypothetical protein
MYSPNCNPNHQNKSTTFEHVVFFILILVVLRGGSSNKEGNVFMLNHKTKLFGPVCDDYWTMNGVSEVKKQKYYSSKENNHRHLRHG